MRYLTLIIASLLLPGLLVAQEVLVDPAEISNALDGDWDTYSGDYTGRRYSSLTQVHKENVSNLTLAWTTEVNFNVRRGNRDGTGIVTQIV